MFEHIPRLFALIHEILFLSIFAATFIRIALSVMFAYSSWANISKLDMVARGYALLEIAVAASLFVGAWTQASAIAGVILLVISLLVPRLRVWPRSTVAMMLVMTLTLVVTGPGAFAFDLPL